MMKRILLMSTLILWALTSFAQNGQNDKSYDAMWKKVHEFDKQDLPKSAEEQVDKILDKASADNNFPQYLRGVLSKADYRMKVSTDSILTDVDEFEKLFDKPIMKNGVDLPVRKALLHTLLTSVYDEIGNSSLAWQNEELRSLTAQRIKEHAKEALADKRSLANVDATPYKALYVEGDDSRLFNDDVLSLVLYFFDKSDGIVRRVSNNHNTDYLVAQFEETSQIYQDLGMRNAQVLIQMRIIQLKSSYSYEKNLSYQERKQAYKELYEKNTDIEAGADAFDAYYDMNAYQSIDEQLEQIRWAKKQWKDSKLAKRFEEQEKKLFDKNVSLSIDGGLYADKDFDIYVRYKNVKKAKLTVTDSKRKVILEKIIDGQLIDDDNHPQREMKDTTTLALPPELYTIKVEAENLHDADTLRISSLKVISMTLPGDGMKVCVVNATTGMPVSNCKVTVGKTIYENYKSKRQKVAEYVTDKNGQVKVENQECDWAFAQLGDNDISNDCRLSKNGNTGYWFSTDPRYVVYTDRAIYKPGQTVYVTGYVYALESQESDTRMAVVNKSLDVTLRDANNENLETKKVITDEFGMATTQFVIPKGRLNGRFTIRFGNESKTIAVEEYKRPTFDVEFEPIEGTFKIGDTVDVVGKATTYSGVPVQGAKVKVDISAADGGFWTYWRYLHNWEIVDNQELETDDEGKFTVKMKLVKKNNQNDDEEDEFDDEEEEDVVTDFSEIRYFKAHAQVTDLAGESHECETAVAVSNKLYDLKISMNNQIDRENPSEIKVEAVNPQGQKVDATGEWMLKKYLGKDYECEEYNCKYADTGINGQFTANQPINIPNWKKMEPGTYRLEVNSTDENGNKYTKNQKFIIYTTKEVPIILDENWCYTPKATISEKDGIDIYYALADTKPFVYAYVVSETNVEKRRLEVDHNKVNHLHLDFKENYKNGLRFLLVYVKNGRQYAIEEKYIYELPNKKLDITWTTFRDKLNAGQDETWTLTIKDKDGQPVQAQMLATMYDASLDALQANSWTFNHSFYRTAPYCYHSQSDTGQSRIYKALDFPSTSVGYFYRYYNSLIPFEYQDMMMMYGSRKANKNVMMALAGNVAGVSAYDDAMVERQVASEEMADAEEDADELKEVVVKTKESETSETPKLRSDFSETAFFYPDLIANHDGQVDISFKLPESLTTWKFMGFAHTKEMDYGIITATAIAKKDFMVQPNMPRFVRTGDKVTITAKIMNQSEADAKGDAVIRLIDSSNEELIYTQKMPFEVMKDKSTAVTFDYQVDDRFNMLICEIYAQSGNFTDGERNWLPVLPDKKYITETVPFYIIGQGKKEVDLSTLFNNNSSTATQRKLTFDYTDNPTWNVVLALHAVMNPTDDDAISWATALYANTAVQHIAKRMSRLQTLIQQWQNETGTETTFQSELDKNQELKDIILQEAPWMMEANEETVYKHQIGELFNENLLNARINKAKAKLQDLQLSNGAWTWFKGMDPSYYTTFAVCDNLAMVYQYLTRNGDECDEDVVDMLQNGLSYLDKEELEDYKEYFKKKDKKALPGNTTMHYMYMVATTGHKTSSSVKAMIDDYLSRLKGHMTDFTTYGKANVAIVLMANNKKTEAVPYVKSLREYLVAKPGMGRYFDGDNTYYSWCDYRIPSHVAAMRAFQATKDEFADAQEILYDMQMWLLRQKQTQRWNSLVNTVNAVDILLTVAPDSAFYQEQLPKVTFVTGNLDIKSQTAGVGFVKEQVPDDMIKATMTNENPTVTVEKFSPGISWGAFYGQSFESLDRMEQNGNELTIIRKFYIEQNGQWNEIPDNYVFKVGDKVKMRHIISADRDMDFVQVRSQHAACLEPLKTRSGYQYLGGRGGYLALHDASADFFFDRFIKGTCTIDLDMYVTSNGDYSNGIATVQCAYAPAFAGHSKGNRIVVK